MSKSTSNPTKETQIKDAKLKPTSTAQKLKPVSKKGPSK